MMAKMIVIIVVIVIKKRNKQESTVEKDFKWEIKRGWMVYSGDFCDFFLSEERERREKCAIVSPRSA